MSGLHTKGSSHSSEMNYYDSEEAEMTVWRSMKLYLYNPQTGTCCDRTAKQWLIMIIYYIGYAVFIVGLYLAFMYGCLLVIKSTNPDDPIVDKESLMDTSTPGLGFVPNIVLTKFPIIWYSPDPIEVKTEDGYKKELDKFFEKYRKADQNNYQDCDKATADDKPCYFNVQDLGDCTQTGYQYTNSSLCFFLKLNRVKRWSPTYYENEREFPEEMTQSMVDLITGSTNKKRIFVECLGENLWDNQHMGEMTYYPQQGFDGHYFPYNGKADYLSPLVGIKLTNVTTGIVIHIKCTVWAKNIGRKLQDAHVKVFIDNTLP